jgi:hypothetical protein
MCLTSLTIHVSSVSPRWVTKKKKEKSPTFLDNDLDFTDAVLMGLESIDDAVLNGRDDVTNPFDLASDGPRQ